MLLIGSAVSAEGARQMTTIVYGSKYDSKLGRADLAKAIRTDIKAAIASGELPKGLKVSVRSGGSSLHTSINITVTACPDVQIYDLGYLRNQSRGGWLADSGRALLAKLDAISGAYNFDGSDIQTDYFHVNFYGHADFSHEMEQADRAAGELAISLTDAYASEVTPADARANDVCAECDGHGCSGCTGAAVSA